MTRALATAAAVLATAAVAGAAEPPRVVLHLPAHGNVARAEHSSNRVLARRLAVLGKEFNGWAGFWVHDLRTGATAGWNSDARFPAASLVKLGVLAAALRRFGPYPERSPAWPDLRAMIRTSDNRAANKLVDRLGGLAPVHEALWRLGMRSSTYPGPYREGTSVGVGSTEPTKSGGAGFAGAEAETGDAPNPPPSRHWRLTTAHDLARALYTFQAAALGNRWIEHRSGLTRHEAEVGLALLLQSVPRGANVGLLRPSLRRVRVAEKNGWLEDMRGTAAIVYFASGPKIVVVLVYRDEVTLREAQLLGRRVAKLVN